MAGVERLKHVERLRAATLPDDEPIGTHPQGVAQEIADRHVTGALGVRGPRLERYDVALAEA